MGQKFDLIRKSDIFSHLSSLKYVSRWVVLLLDTLLCVFAFFLAIFFTERYSIQIPEFPSFGIAYRLLLLLFLQICFFWIFHTYSGVLRYSSFVDVSKVTFAVGATSLFAWFINIIVFTSTGRFVYSNLGLILYFLFAFFFLFSLRFVVKTAFGYLNLYSGNATRVMIYGTKSAGIAIAKMLRTIENDTYRVVGFIDDKDSVVNRLILGLKVYPKDEHLIPLMRKLRVNKVIVSALKMQSINTSTDLDIFIDNNINVLYAPSITDWDNNSPHPNQSIASQIKNIRIEDLLERSPIKLNLEPLRQQIKGAVVLVTGAAGSIGSEIARQVAKKEPHLLVLLDQAESPLHDFRLEISNTYPTLNFIPCIADIRSRERVEEVISMYKPDIIYHAAAYKHVPLMEEHPCESIHANVMGTKNVADMAIKYGVKRFVMVSTDKAVNPTNIMGASKRIAEIYVQSLFKKTVQTNPDCTKFITTRFGNVLGSNGSVIPYFRKQIEQGGPVTVTHPDIIRYFMTIPEACMLVCEAGLMGNGGEIFVFDMGHPVKILDLAKKMIRLSGYTPGTDIKIVFTGLRPGEKLYEELLNKKELTIPTDNPSIMVAKVREFDFDKVSVQIDKLIKMADLGKTFLAVSTMKEIVPEFKSNNSPFEELDIKEEGK